ncbi:MAG: hypothetical protein ACR2OI_12795 [Acidimicrobiia bacterium]
MTTRKTKRGPDDYRSSLLDMLGLSSPYEHGITQARPDIRLARPPTARDVDTRFPSIQELPQAGSTPDEGTAGLVQRLWQASEAFDDDLIIEDWAPEAPVDRAVGRYRWAWWPVLLGALVIGMILVTMNLRGIPVKQAEDLRQDWTVLALEVESGVDGARQAALVITNPSSNPTDLAEARNSLLAFDVSADTLESQISQPFPSPPPLASGDAFDSLKPIQSDLVDGAVLVTDAQDALSDAIKYRSLLDSAFLLPALPIVADEVTLAGLGEQLANSVAASRAAVRQLPIGPSFDTHRNGALGLVNRLETWQASYLDALRLGDIDAATELKIEINTRINNLRASVGEPLGLVAIQVNADLDELEVLLGDSLAALAVTPQ